MSGYRLIGQSLFVDGATVQRIEDPPIVASQSIYISSAAKYRSPWYVSYVYALVDPIKRSIRYIGQTTDPVSRIRTHCCWKRARSIKDDWIADLYTRGTVPILTVVGVGGISEETALAASVVCAGADLLNNPRSATMKGVSAARVTSEATVGAISLVRQIESVDWMKKMKGLRSSTSPTLTELDAMIDSLAMRNRVIYERFGSQP